MSVGVKSVSQSTVFCRCVIAALGIGLLGGCGSSNSTSVSGKVTFDGAPVKQGTVMFVPDGKGLQATGDLNPDGTYTLFTTNPGDGVQPGKYRVSITAVELPSDVLPDAPASALPKLLIPERYNSHLSSQLSFDVVEGKKNEANFDLKK